MSLSQKSIAGQSFISVSDLSDQDILEVFKRARHFKKLTDKNRPFTEAFDIDASQFLNSFLLFEEPSTRTRISFEIASQKLGVYPIVISNIKSSSMMKGETVEQTLATLACFKPAFIVLRYKLSIAPSKKLNFPIVNAGFGSYEHPTQALLDAFTIQEAKGDLQGKKVLIVGDVLHSRVSNSNLKLLKHLGAKVAFCSPSSLFPQGDLWKDVQEFKNLDEGIKWADVLMCLRIQEERHNMNIGLSIAEYRDYYHLGAKQLEIFSKKGIIMHPGPYVFGVEIGQEVLQDPRNLILKQVENGVYVRAALLSILLNYKWKD